MVINNRIIYFRFSIKFNKDILKELTVFPELQKRHFKYILKEVDWSSVNDLSEDELSDSHSADSAANEAPEKVTSYKSKSKK